MKKRLLCLLLGCLLLLSSCTGSLRVQEDTQSSTATLPPAQVTADAPIGDAGLQYTRVVDLFLPRQDGARLVAVQQEVLLNAARSPAEAVVRALLAFEGNDYVRPLTQNAALTLSGQSPVEVARDVVTVNLGASALLLDREELYTVCQALTNTLTGCLPVTYVNVLVSGRAVGLDVGDTLPAGCFVRRTGEDLSALWEKALVQKTPVGESLSANRLSAVTTLYFPAKVGNGILPEARTVFFESQAPGDMALTLLTELSHGASYMTNVPSLPDLAGFTAQTPTVTENAATGTRTLEILFAAGLNEQLALLGVTRSALMAAITYTMTTFLPGITYVRVSIGDELITYVSPSSSYIAESTIAFENGQMQRSQFASFLLSYATLYLANGQTLTKVERPVPWYDACNPRYLLLQLGQGSRSYDNVLGLTAVLSGEMKDSDLLGFSLSGRTLYVHFAEGFLTQHQGITGEQERLLVYAMVNTLLAAVNADEVCFFFAGGQADTLAGEIYWRGTFRENTGIVRK